MFENCLTPLSDSNAKPGKGSRRGGASRAFAFFEIAVVIVARPVSAGGRPRALLNRIDGQRSTSSFRRNRQENMTYAGEAPPKPSLAKTDSSGPPVPSRWSRPSAVGDVPSGAFRLPTTQSSPKAGGGRVKAPNCVDTN
jgi:hypothetical protein